MAADLEGSITLGIAGHPFTLAGKLAPSSGTPALPTAIIVNYHREFADAVSLGTLTSIATEIGTVLGVDEIATAITQAFDELKSIDILSGVAKSLEDASLRITDLGINTLTKTYVFGFGLDFSTDPLTIPAINLSVQSLGLKVTYKKP